MIARYVFRPHFEIRAYNRSGPIKYNNAAPQYGNLFSIFVMQSYKIRKLKRMGLKEQNLIIKYHVINLMVRYGSVWTTTHSFESLSLFLAWLTFCLGLCVCGNAVTQIPLIMYTLLLFFSCSLSYIYIKKKRVALRTWSVFVLLV